MHSGIYCHRLRDMYAVFQHGHRSLIGPSSTHFPPRSPRSVPRLSISCRLLPAYFQPCLTFGTICDLDQIRLRENLLCLEQTLGVLKIGPQWRTQMTAYLATKSILILKGLNRGIQKGASALTIGSNRVHIRLRKP